MPFLQILYCIVKTVCQIIIEAGVFDKGFLVCGRGCNFVCIRVDAVQPFVAFSTTRILLGRPHLRYLRAVSKIPATSKEYFGRPGQGRKHTRNIESDNPARTAAEFASIASRSHVSAIPIEGKGMVCRMRDGSVVSHRYVSSSKDGSPVVELKVKNASGIKSQKIHFVKKGK